MRNKLRKLLLGEALSVGEMTSDGGPSRRSRAASATFQALLLGRYTGLLVAFGAVCVYFGFKQDAFFTWDNFVNVASSNSPVLILALGATFVLIAGGIDLSAASATALCGMVLGVTLQAGWGFVPCAAVVILCGIGLGLTNGILITAFKIPFLVVTLGTLSIYASIALVLREGSTINVFQFHGYQPLADLTNNDVGPIPVLLLLDLVLILVAGGVLALRHSDGTCTPSGQTSRRQG